MCVLPFVFFAFRLRFICRAAMSIEHAANGIQTASECVQFAFDISRVHPGANHFSNKKKNRNILVSGRPSAAVFTVH